MGEMADDMINDFMDPDFEDWIESEVSKKKPKVPGSKAKGYKRMHEDGKGRLLPIATMDNRHIENFINLCIRRMMEIKDSALYEVGDTTDMFFRELNGVQKMSKSDAINVISAIIYRLEPYFTELVIRGNNSYILNISSKLEQILGRNKISGNHLLKD